MAEHYTILFEGQILPGFDRETVKEKLAGLLKADSEAIEIMFSGKPVVIRKNVAPEIGEKYRAAMERAGALCTLRKESAGEKPAATQKKERIEAEPDSETPVMAAAESYETGPNAFFAPLRVKQHYTTTPNGGRMIITNIEGVPGKNIVEHFGIVSGSTIRAKHIGKDLMASLKNLVGGELKGYTELLKESRDQAVARMTRQAEQIGANAIVNVRFSTSSVAQGAAELYAYGTAVRVE